MEWITFAGVMCVLGCLANIIIGGIRNNDSQQKYGGILGCVGLFIIFGMMIITWMWETPTIKYGEVIYRQKMIEYKWMPGLTRIEYERVK